MKKLLLLILIIGLFSCCKTENKPDQNGNQLPENIVENSGMAYSRETKQLYTIQDSGHEARIYVTSLDGILIKYIDLDVSNQDWEDISLGPCGQYFSDKQCLYVADIGDNTSEREYVEIHVLPEHFTGKFKTIRVKYNDGPTNAESMFVRANGDIYIINKNYDKKKHKIYLIKNGVAEFIRYLDITEPIGAADISFSDKRIVATTTDTGIFYLIKTKDYSIKPINIYQFCCEESVAWVNDSEFIYSTEGLAQLILWRIHE